MLSAPECMNARLENMNPVRRSAVRGATSNGVNVLKIITAGAVLAFVGFIFIANGAYGNSESLRKIVVPFLNLPKILLISA